MVLCLVVKDEHMYVHIVLKCVPQSGTITAKQRHACGIQLGSRAHTWHTPSNNIRDIHFTLSWQAKRTVVAARFEKKPRRVDDEWVDHPNNGHGWELIAIIPGEQLLTDMKNCLRANQCNGSISPTNVRWGIVISHHTWSLVCEFPITVWWLCRCD
jgi:hypothetical protein